MFPSHIDKTHKNAIINKVTFPYLICLRNGSYANGSGNTMILNLTQHDATADQIAAGVVEPADKQAVRSLITFDTLPSREEIKVAAEAVAKIADEAGAEMAMIGGAPFFMAELERQLFRRDIYPVYAFSRRESVDAPDGNGGVRKTQVFRHEGFVKAL